MSGNSHSYSNMPLEVRRLIQHHTASSSNAVALQVANSALYRGPTNRVIEPFMHRLGLLLRLLLKDDVHQVLIAMAPRAFRHFIMENSLAFSPFAITNVQPPQIPREFYGRPYVILPSQAVDGKYMLIQNGRRSDNLSQLQILRFFSAVMAQHVHTDFISTPGQPNQHTHECILSIVYTASFQMFRAEDMRDFADACWFEYKPPDWKLDGEQQLLF